MDRNIEIVNQILDRTSGNVDKMTLEEKIFLKCFYRYWLKETKKNIKIMEYFADMQVEKDMLKEIIGNNDIGNKLQLI
ncbi:hypothetical protein [Thermoanaerobacterium thermosulfurigenes]|uniref:hypothetical protein n=1 Tax=Thermoanaerobacterium thermosulfurigenes TaxID=33950 RepID=UPI003EF50F9B